MAVGLSAALVHAGVLAVLRDVLWPELANACGFVLAFGWSFAGHRWRSFRGSRTPLGSSLRRFAGTALAGFVLNELVFVALLRLVGWPLWGAWLLAQAAAALQTFVLSRYWAFQR